MQKRFITVLSVLMLTVMMLSALLVSCGQIAAGLGDGSGNPGDTSGSSENDPYQLQILNSGLKLTQDQVMSQIKAEYLIANNGYSDEDPIVAIVTLPGLSLLEKYLEDEETEATSVAEYARTDEGIAYLEELSAAQTELVDELISTGLAEKVEYRYSTVMNAVAVHTTYGKFADISGNASVKGALLSDTYNRPKEVDASAIINEVDIYDTGIFNPGVVDYTGKGTAVAVLDSGFDCDHTVFQHALSSSDILIDRQKVALMLAESIALQLDGTTELMDVYVSNKIPFAFDYADKDHDVYPYDSEHGTHVAGIIGGQDDTITGVAVDTQLVLMKVFPDLQQGGKTEDILAALEDAVLLGVDAINMSLGTSCGFAREVDKVEINRVYDLISESGISLITAASNDYSSAFGGEQGNTNKVTNPDSGTVGSPSTYHAALSVASISGTKSNYLVGNGEQIVFFNESNSVAGKPNDFFAELYASMGWDPTDVNAVHTLEYVTIPGVGMKANYNGLDVKGKIALVRRGDTTFEDKALQAKNAGAIACIIYNNIEGEILMSMGKSDHIPTVSISKENGTRLAQRSKGSFVIKYSQQAGPFMSDFSSWGPTPNLELKPEITAHGGNILSSVPGGGYDELSGTSMATPNLCGIVVLIRQYLKEEYPDRPMLEINKMCNQLLMSTANIILNEQGNPYSPRKQGAGLASLYNVVKTGAYLTVDGTDRSKIEFGDDAERQGVYTKTFHIVNISDRDISYALGVIPMTETVSSSDKDFVAEKSRILGGTLTADVSDGGTLRGDIVTVRAGMSAAVTVTYTMDDEDKAYIGESFPYGMYVEGFFTLEPTDDAEIPLNIPFLAFYGDWTEAPMFDKTYYEVDPDKHNAAIDEEDKLKADYYATTPYGSYYYNYIIPLGTYLYDVDTSAYDNIAASTDHIAISNALGSIDGIHAVYAGLLRGAKQMTFTVTDKVTGEVVIEKVASNMLKAHSNGGSPIPGYEELKWKADDLLLLNNREYEFRMEGLLDYGDGGATTNVRNSFSFDFCVDTEAPVIRSASYEKIYDKTQKKDRYYLTLTVYDNHYVQSISPVAFTSSSTYTVLTDNPIPVYSERGKDNTVRFEITDYLDDLYADEIATSALAFSVDDYALNSQIYFCQLPGTRGDFKFTSDGTMDGSPIPFYSMYEDEVVDLTQFLATADKTVDENKDYLKYLQWTSSNENVALVQDGQVWAIAPGRATVTVSEALNEKQATLIINVKERADTETASASQPPASAASGGWQLFSRNDAESASGEALKSIRFSYFKTLYAHPRSAQTSEIGETGSRVYINSLSGGLSFYPGESIQLFYDMEPWYVSDRYPVTFVSTNENVATVDQDGVVTALKKGSTNIVLKVDGSNITARLRITVNSEFVIENRTLVAYKGVGGDVVIPDDEGILYIGAYAFCLYDTDREVEVTEDDWDANKIPYLNNTVTSVVVPEGVEEIQKYAFYNCKGLESVTLPSSIKNVREYAFYEDAKLTTVNLENVQVIGAYAFSGCTSLENIALNKTYAIGMRAFQGCTSLTFADLRKLRNAGSEAFRDCTALTSVELTEKTKLSEGMFAASGLTSVDIYATISVPAYCFARCEQLATVTLHNGIGKICEGAFAESGVTSLVFLGTVDRIEERAFFDCDGLTALTLPDGEVSLGFYSFYDCDNLASAVFGTDTVLTAVEAAVFQKTALSGFTVPAGNTHYSVSGDGALLLNKAENAIILAATAFDFGDYILPAAYTAIGDGAFSGCGIRSLTVTGADTVIGAYAFVNCDKLTAVRFPASAGVRLGDHAFHYATALTAAENLSYITEIGDYAFSNTALTSVTVGADATVGEGAFFQTRITELTVGPRAVLGAGSFQSCSYLRTVQLPENGNVSIGFAAFANDISLTRIHLAGTDGKVAEQTYLGCTALSEADLTGVREIGAYAFGDCSALNRVVMDQVVTIGEGAFARATEKGTAPVFSRLDLPDTLTTIGDGAFLGCAGLTEITVPASVTSIGGFTFAYCTALGTVSLSAGVSCLGDYCFTGCSSLSEINTEHITEIGAMTFSSCEALQTADLTAVQTVGEGAFYASALSGALEMPALTSVGDYAFDQTSVTSVEAGALTHIGEGAFAQNPYLAQFVFSPSLEEIGTLAFNECPALVNFYVRVDGTLTDTADIGSYARLAEGILYTALPSGNWQLASVPGGKEMTVLTLPEGTVKVEMFAGNGNPHIQTVVLPSTMRFIGAHAFDGYTGLETVEFRSFTAPKWEDYYDKNAHLQEGDPGYDLLHNQIGIFDLELYYYNFVGLLGTFEPIAMILPSNPDAEGYDALHYLVAFGPVGDAQRSDFVAMDRTLSDFVEYAKKIAQIRVITLTDEALINKAVTCLNAMKQNPTDFGYTEQEWEQMVQTVTGAKATLMALKLANASQAAQELQRLIDALPDTYSASAKDAMREITERLSALPITERSVLTLTKYNALLDAYEADIADDITDPEPDDPGTEDPDAPGNEPDGDKGGLPGYAIALIVIAACAAVGGAGAAVTVVIVRKKRGN